MDTAVLKKARWGVVLMGAVSGLFTLVLASLLVFLIVDVLRLTDLSDTGQFMVITFALFVSQLIAGYVSGRLASADQPAFHGSLGGMALYSIFAILSLAAGSPAPIFTLVLFALVAAIIGYAGGALAARPKED